MRFAGFFSLKIKKMEMQEVSGTYTTSGLSLPQIFPDVKTWA